MFLSILWLTSTPPPSSNPWQDAGLGVVVAILVGIATIVTTVAITIWAVRKQRNQKQITYQVISDASFCKKNWLLSPNKRKRLPHFSAVAVPTGVNPDVTECPCTSILD